MFLNLSYELFKRYTIMISKADGLVWNHIRTDLKGNKISFSKKYHNLGFLDNVSEIVWWSYNIQGGKTVSDK